MNFTTKHICFYFSIVVCSRFVSEACYIQGQDSGECVGEEELAPSIPYCAEYVQYTACAPKYQRTWWNFTTSAKDKWIKATVNKIVQERKRHEMNLTMQEYGVNEYGDSQKVGRRFWNGNYDDPDGLKFFENKGGQDLSNCEYAYKRYMCYLNFPRCDDEGKSLILCRSVCENYANACGIPKDLNRCGPNEWMGADKPEIPELNPETKENTLFIRGIWPGWPFRDYMELGWQNDEQGNYVMSFEPVVRCTPSIKGAAPTSHVHKVTMFLLFLVEIVLLMNS
jgi:hypothetical protein